MSYRIKLLPEARQDILDSIGWYNEQKEGLGQLFYQAIKSRLAYISNNPLHYQISYRNIRNALVSNFPYQVHYWIEETSKLIIVFAITHTRRNPDVWNDRK
mgnify:CR=1 FL=1|tara:strand:+ start:1522 stop:1824 length:303 start_codon:yes stop_codon:yes gene_type:complete